MFFELLHTFFQTLVLSFHCSCLDNTQHACIIWQECTIFRCVVTSDGNVFIMTTVMLTPASAGTVTNECLGTIAAEVIQPYSTMSQAITVWCRPTNKSAVFIPIQHFWSTWSDHNNTTRYWTVTVTWKLPIRIGGILQTRYPSCHQVNRVKAAERTIYNLTLMLTLAKPNPKRKSSWNQIRITERSNKSLDHIASTTARCGPLLQMSTYSAPCRNGQTYQKYVGIFSNVLANTRTSQTQNFIHWVNDTSVQTHWSHWTQTCNKSIICRVSSRLLSSPSLSLDLSLRLSHGPSVSRSMCIHVYIVTYHVTYHVHVHVYTINHSVFEYGRNDKRIYCSSTWNLTFFLHNDLLL